MTCRDSAFQTLRGGGQPAIFVTLAIQIAALADKLQQAIRCTAFGYKAPRPMPQHPPLGEWLAMYRNHRRMQNALAIADGIPDDINASELLDEIRSLSRMSEDEIKAEITECSTEELQQFLAPFIGIPFPPDESTLRKMLEELDSESECSDTDKAGLFDAALDAPEGQYFFRVWLPCWVIYREFPPRLLRAARLGDLDALDRLLRLDKLIVGDPRIARLIAQTMTTGTQSERRQLTAALSGKPKKRLTDKAMRSGLGGLISQLAVLFQSSVTAPQIEELFNRIEQIRSGKPADPAVPTAETWSKAIQRNRDWPSLPTR